MDNISEEPLKLGYLYLACRFGLKSVDELIIFFSIQL